MLHAVSLQHFAFGDFVLKVPRAGTEPSKIRINKNYFHY